VAEKCKAKLDISGEKSVTGERLAMAILLQRWFQQVR
jgi:hypothetical protein